MNDSSQNDRPAGGSGDAAARTQTALKRTRRLLRESGKILEQSHDLTESEKSTQKQDDDSAR